MDQSNAVINTNNTMNGHDNNCSKLKHDLNTNKGSLGVNEINGLNNHDSKENHDTNTSHHIKNGLNIIHDEVAIAKNTNLVNSNSVSKHGSNNKYVASNNNNMNENNDIVDETDTMDKHYNVEKVAISQYPCTLCSKVYNTELDLTVHIEWHKAMTKHMNSSFVKLKHVTIYKCDLCTLIFTSKESLKIHRKKYFMKDRSLQHQKHDPSKPYHCKTCGWSYMQKSTLKAHSATHKPAPHVCECGVGYYRKSDLDSHRLLVKHFEPKSTLDEEPSGDEADHLSQNEADDVSIKEEEPSEKDSDNSDTEYRPKSKARPPKKASLTFKQSNHSQREKNKKALSDTNKNTNKRKRQSYNKRAIEYRVDGQPKFVKMDEKGYECPVCRKRNGGFAWMKWHLKRIHGWTFEFERQCKICNKMFADVRSMQSHMVVHTGERPYPCSLCNKSFTQPGAVKLHVRRVHDRSKDFKCDSCPKTFADKGSLQLHSRVHSGEKPYECDTCGKRFADPSAFARHRLTHTGRKPYACALCPKAFCDPSALYRHRGMHAGVRAACPHCARTFATAASRNTHVRTQHAAGPLEDKFECDYCGKKFVAREYLKLHITRLHLRLAKKADCEICKASVEVSAMSKHMKRHLRQYPHRCEECGHRFLERVELRNHWQRRHGPRRPRDFECDHCHLAFTDKMNILRHIVNCHMGHRCQHCKRNFTTSRALKAHAVAGCVRCPVCDAAFDYRSSRALHMATHHRRRGQPMLECEHCLKLFATEPQLKAHVVRHTARADAFRCDACGAGFRTRNNIVAHIWEEHMTALYCDVCMKRFYCEAEFRRHKRGKCAKEFRCDICNKTVTTSSSLSNHIATHLPPRRECDLCGRKFRMKDTLSRHFKLVHKML